MTNFVNTADDELYKGLEAQRTALKRNDSSNIKTESGGSDNVISQPRAQNSGAA
ncbi:hypothetical protein BX616_002838 [Lobosporangium transversale]|uniref:Uncharacterized protein n=1 Tax=Lobosporangium transversale TaxID=64571 RepID=A0A1Y2G7V8_9FUNG|nr:hypothetical protein BCR41DRAFT_401917 [Lobosporangium transversale]KAF9899800.1 hypothetical protein BX616_002838 [Lobosporangium transversale]ORY98326.1 hypothetical protein BCR41DRAFT_401917 [Lobosporangium transversale]|eukprot:XP_021875737.1 hypothetical protein BCR41DRAFT_401917 [Lobosporangium transversale]